MVDGLSSARAKDQLAYFGANTFHKSSNRSLLVQYITRFKNPLVIILLLASMVRGMINGPTYGMMHAVTPDRVRATAMALFLFCSSLAGGVGSMALGALSDVFAAMRLQGHGLTLAMCDGGLAPTSPLCADARANGLQLALTVLSACCLICAVIYLRAAKFMVREQQA